MMSRLAFGVAIGQLVCSARGSGRPAVEMPPTWNLDGNEVGQFVLHRPAASVVPLEVDHHLGHPVWRPHVEMGIAAMVAPPLAGPPIPKLPTDRVVAGGDIFTHKEVAEEVPPSSQQQPAHSFQGSTGASGLQSGRYSLATQAPFVPDLHSPIVSLRGGSGPHAGGDQQPLLWTFIHGPNDAIEQELHDAAAAHPVLRHLGESARQAQAEQQHQNSLAWREGQTKQRYPGQPYGVQDGPAVVAAAHVARAAASLHKAHMQSLVGPVVADSEKGLSADERAAKRHAEIEAARAAQNSGNSTTLRDLRKGIHATGSNFTLSDKLMDQLSTVAEEATSLKAQDDDALEDEDGIPTSSEEKRDESRLVTKLEQMADQVEEANNELRAQVNDPNQVPLSNAALKELDTLVDKVETARDEIESIQISDDSRPKEVQERVKDLLSDLEFMQDETKNLLVEVRTVQTQRAAQEKQTKKAEKKHARRKDEDDEVEVEEVQNVVETR
eukprot:INCI13481.11.p2 GENE.INCI13481.11~~INCI13481.11.p2  ORF type:complete len:497 (+),score=106.40 INCI13481.11:318-1808(+)